MSLIEVRKEKKSRKPHFVTQDSWKRKLLPKSWRKPKGLHSKMRLKKKGNPKLPSAGYRAPKAIRGFHSSGVKAVHINSVSELENVKDAIIIASTVGTKKKLAIINAAVEKKLAILNIDTAAFTKKIAADMAERKKKAKKAIVAKTPKKTVEEKPKEQSEDEKRKEGKKEIEKIITKRD